MRDLLLGVDLGTTSTKLVVVEPGRGVLAADSLPVELHSPRAGWAEADTREWWSNVCALVPRVAKQAGIPASDIGAVAASGMVPAVVPVDAEGRALRRAILQNDARAVDEIDQLAARLADTDLLALTGSALTQQSVAPTLVWLATHEPDIWRRTTAVLGSYDWLARALGADVHVESNWALESGLYTLEGELAGVVVDAALVSAEKLPSPARPGSVVGAVGAAAAEATGLAAGTPIVVGGADHVLSAYAAGLTDPGDWLVKLGGAGDILAVTVDRLLDPRLYLDEHPVPGRWLPNGCMATSGSMLRWVQRLVGDVSLELLDKEAEKRAAASLVCQPYFLGEKSPLHDPDLRGSFVGLHLGHDRADVYRSCLEAIAYGFRQHTEIFAERGVRLGLGRVTNGGSRSMLWKRILADVLGRPLYPVTDHPGAALGAAAAAGVGTGVFSDWAEGAGVVRLGSPVEPTGETAYEEGYQMYLDLQDRLRDTSHRLAARSRE
ncbi:MAG: carbohydrate kinase [Streptosporangiales bacterium]|nr:carbohydrate kinase [Streptosporangiales bacterium]